MVDIGPAHRTEYELGNNRAEIVCIAEAPGRLHYLGEHGEPGRGLYLSSAVDRAVRVAVSARKDSSLRFYAADMGERKRTTLANLRFKREDRWANYVKLAVHIFAGLGKPAKGLNFTISGNIPATVGLGSSQAVEVASVMALKAFYKASFAEQELATLIAKSRAEFFGKPASPVDYLLMLSAKKDHFLVIDESNLEVRRIKSPLSRYKIILMDSRVPRLGAEDELAMRAEDAQEGLKLLIETKRARKGAKSTLRDFAPSDLLETMGTFPEQIRRRSLHVVSEIRRVSEAEIALMQADLAEAARLIYHSHESLRDLYEVSCPEIDWLVKRSQENPGILASRMAGAGFGGCAYTILKESAREDYEKRLEEYERIFGFHPLTHEIKPAPGARVVSLRA